MAIAAAVVVFGAPLDAQRGGRGLGGGRGFGGPAVPRTPQASAPFDLTGQWVSLVTEDWRYRQFAAPKGDYGGLPLSPAARKIADGWDPARDEAAGESCRAYGAAGLLQIPTRVRIAWENESTLTLESDAGTQTRRFRFGTPQGEGGDWQGVSLASWDAPQPPISGRGGFGSRTGGSLKVVTTRMKPGYLRRNGVPYGANAVLTEYFDRFDVPGGESLLNVTAEVVDPENLSGPYWTSHQFKRETDTSSWRPSPCSAR